MFKFKILKLSFLTLFSLFKVTSALGGAVSGGGGGVTNPSPSSPEWVVGAIKEAGPIVRSWLNRQEAQWKALTPIQQNESPLRPVFQAKQSIFQTLHAVNIELKMNAPCFDQDNNPRDGSVYSDRPKTICLSPYSMAPKLNQYNVQEETLALLIHELTHLVGGTEEEAIAIQKLMLSHLHEIDLKSYLIQLQTISKDENFFLSSVMDDLEFWIATPKRLNTRDLAYWGTKFMRIYEEIEERLTHLAPLNHQKSSLFFPFLIKHWAGLDFVCQIDPNETPVTREHCLKNLDTGFATDTVVTAKQYFSRVHKPDEDEVFGPEFDQVTLKRPSSLEDVAQELKHLQDFLKLVTNEIKTLYSFKLKYEKHP